MSTSTRARPFIRALASVAGALLLLAGCGDEPAAAPAPLDKKPAATTSPTPTAVAPPALPAEAQGASNAAAVAFVEHYIDVLNYTAATLDTTALDDLSADNCEACKGVLIRTAEMQIAGGRIEGGAWAIAESVVLSTASDIVPVQILVDRAKEVTTDRAGEDPIAYPASRVLLLVELRQSQDGWLVANLERVDK